MELLIGRIYQHYKGMNYEIVAFAKHSETLEELIIYKALYNEGQIWARPKNMFFDLVNIGDKQILRFKLIEQKDD